jgi:NADH:ubiquinone oxidoreductase subunit 6 (subunit J)
VAFYILIVLAIAPTVAILFVRNVLDAALCLMVTLLAIAGLYILLDAGFLAIVQVLVYAGGILLLIMFGIMITRQQELVQKKRLIIAVLLAALLSGLLWTGLQEIEGTTVPSPETSAAQIGVSLMTQYAVPFEIGGILLLVSMIGAMNTSTFRSRT